MKNIKIKTDKKLDWHLLAKDLLCGLFLSQQDLAEQCQVSQQSISNWKNKTRNPGIFARQMLFKLAQKEKLDLSKYEVDNVNNTIARQLEKGNSKEISRLLEIYGKMSNKARVKFLRYGNTLVK